MEAAAQRSKVAGEVRAAVARANVPLGVLATATGINPTVLARKLNGSSPIGLEEIVAISRALNLHPSQLVHDVLDAAA